MENQKSIVVRCAYADDGRSHQTTAVPSDVVDGYKRSGRPYLCFLCRSVRIADKAGYPIKEESAQDRNAIYDKWGRVKDVVSKAAELSDSEEAT